MTRGPQKPWTAEDNDVLRELWEADADTDEMAETLGRSRFAVLKHAGALGLPRRRPDALPWTATEIATLRTLFERGLSDTEIAEKIDTRSLEAIRRQRAQAGLLRRGGTRTIERPSIVVGPARTCQWIEGDPRSGNWTMCGKPSIEGYSYCAEHARRAYVQAGAPRAPKKQFKDPLRRVAGVI